MNLCPCGSERDFAACCGIYILNNEKPTTPEQLMRSRYSAYVLKDIEYIVRTMKGTAAKDFNKEEAMSWVNKITWLGLEVLYAQHKKNRGRVEFIARYQHEGIQNQIHEISDFIFEDNQWYYVDGRMIQSNRKKR